MYLDPEPLEITRHLIDLPGRQVHCRICGSGPPLVLLHQSPTSSAELATEILLFSRRFTVICPDTPGFGQSDPLPAAEPELADFADALAELLDRLQLREVLVYGFHTGAMIGVEFARRHKSRCAAVVVNGLVVLTAAERSDILARYLGMPAAEAWGGHLAWAWSRIRDQLLFFPWYDRRRAARMEFDLPPAEFLQPFVLDLLRAPDAGRAGYRAAFAYPTEDFIGEITVPLYLFNFASDPIAGHPERLPKWPSSASRERFDEPESLQHRALEVLARHAPATAGIPLPLPPAPASAVAVRRDIVNTPSGPVPLLVAGATSAPALLLIHDAGSAANALRELAEGLAGQYRVLVPDLPGHGDAGALHLPDYAAATVAEVLVSVMDGQGAGHAEVIALGAGSLIAAALARSAPLRVTGVTVIDPWWFGAEERAGLRADYAPEFTPEPGGGHLLRAWCVARDSELFWPWYATQPRNALVRDPDIEPAATHQRAEWLLQAGPAFRRLVRDLLDYEHDGIGSLAGMPVRTCLRTGNRPDGQSAAAGHAEPFRLPAKPAEWPGILLSLLREIS